MSDPDKSVLIVEDDPGIATLMRELVEDLGCQAQVAHTGREVLALLAGDAPTLMLLDYSLPDMNGLTLLDRLQQAGLEIPPFIVTTGAGDEHIAVEMMRRDAHNYLIKDHEFLDVLAGTLSRALREIEMARQLKEAEQRLRLFASIVESTNEGLYVTTSEHLITEVNPACEQITGYRREFLIGKTPHVLLSGRQADTKMSVKIMATLRDEGRWQGEVLFRRSSGGLFTAWVNIVSLIDENYGGKVFVTLFSDISTVKASAEHLDYLAHHDPLTGLPNRLLLNARLRHSLERAQRSKTGLGLLYLDLDHFKEVNDRLGHAAGDDLLCELARSMKAVLRQEDTLARLGGDEFVMIIEDADEVPDLKRVVEQLLRIFPHPVDTPQGVVNVSASIGGVMYPANGDDSKTLLERADRAMYAAKQAGRNTYVPYRWIADDSDAQQSAP
jgi:diguanylate cyclase (GGDEF)-like protein/PAS domain S-box-containing protein